MTNNKPVVECSCGYQDLYSLMEEYVENKEFDPIIVSCPNCGKKVKVTKNMFAEEAETGARVNTMITLDDVEEDICKDCDSQMPSCNNCLGS